jgi:tripartite-type tricarboxylate transporter receptor subunit TctC
MMGRRIVAAALLCGISFGAMAQDYPQRPVQVIVPFGAGTGLDIVARFVAERLGKEWGSNVVVENRAGSNGIIGTNAVARAAPDGHTLLATSQTFYTNAYLQKNLPYDPQSFVPVARMASTQLVIVAASSAKFNDMKSLIAEAKAQPMKLTFASQGNGSSAHMAGAWFDSMAGTKMLHIPYKESSQGVTDTIRGEVSLFFVAISVALPHMKSGRLKAIAVTGLQRSAQLPDVPTVSESGLPGYTMVTWHVLLAPGGTPAALVEKISNGVMKVASAPDFAKVLLNQGLDPMLDSAKDLAAKLPGELAYWQKVVDATGVKLD